MNSKILALFDFCETITDFQTLERYLPLIGKHNRHCSRLQNALRRRIYRVRNIIRRRILHKPAIEYPRFEMFIGFPYERAKALAQDFVKSEILSNLNPLVIQKLRYHQQMGHTIVIVSGGLSIYIDEFAKLFDITHVVAVDLEVRGGKLTGNIDGIHTMQERKLYKLDDMLDLSKYDLPNSYAYSDCASDVPLLSLVGNPCVIECGKNLRWAEMLKLPIMRGK